MALPIKETPILEGKHADDFLKKAFENESKSISQEEYNNLKRSHEKFQSFFSISETEPCWLGDRGSISVIKCANCNAQKSGEIRLTAYDQWVRTVK